ncbi:MAG: MBL fold metallo-hydrolase [Oscillospiraceae bacterium]|jgi:metallo-beta-lactamase family protein|nr:MBL fold metallo-hydrolase [Oscillospiraceae bacterium]
MKITFLGAAHEVTGSATLLEAGGKKILVDCGMEQGKDTFENQTPLPIAPEVDCVLLTHAHIDHSGNLPLLYKNGFKGPVYATEATYHLCEIMLMDCAHIQMADVERQNRKGKRSGDALLEPLYDTADAQGVLAKFRPCDYNREVQVFENLTVRFLDAGHLLGSSSIEIWLSENGQTRKILFSGDVGNSGKPIVGDPQTSDGADFVIIESTYGNRLHHKERPDYYNELLTYVERTLSRGGNVVIPSFAVGRAQEMLYLFREINNERRANGLAAFPVYLDSPMAGDATGVFLQCDISYFGPETRSLLSKGVNPLMFEGFNISESTQDSREINDDATPKVIISASGMCEAGRIRHHLKHNLWRADSLILFVGYQANGTLGRLILDGLKKVKLFGEEISVHAEIGFLNGVSGHADKQGLLDWINAIGKKPGCVFVNHGEDEVCTEFTSCLREEYGYNAFAPYSGSEFDLVTGLPLVSAQGVPAEKRGGRDTRAAKAFARLMSAVRRLSNIAGGCEGMPNKELAKFADQIDQISNKLSK